MNDVTSRYRIQRLRPTRDVIEEPVALSRIGRGSSPPPPDPPGRVRQQRVGEHDVEIQRDGAVVMIALPGALRLRGRPDQIRGLAAALLAALDG